MRICPESNVKKATYECFTFKAKEILDSAGKTPKELIGLNILSDCKIAKK